MSNAQNFKRGLLKHHGIKYQKRQIKSEPLLTLIGLHAQINKNAITLTGKK